MRSALINGKISTPASRSAAERRLEHVLREKHEIDAQLDDPTRVARLGETAYDRWKAKARAARHYLDEEARQLNEWLANLGASPAHAPGHKPPHKFPCDRKDCDHPTCVQAQIDTFWSTP